MTASNPSPEVSTIYYRNISTELHPLVERGIINPYDNPGYTGFHIEALAHLNTLLDNPEFPNDLSYERCTVDSHAEAILFADFIGSTSKLKSEVQGQNGNGKRGRQSPVKTKAEIAAYIGHSCDFIDWWNQNKAGEFGYIHKGSFKGDGVEITGSKLGIIALGAYMDSEHFGDTDREDTGDSPLNSKFRRLIEFNPNEDLEEDDPDRWRVSVNYHNGNNHFVTTRFQAAAVERELVAMKADQTLPQGRTQIYSPKFGRSLLETDPEYDSSEFITEFLSTREAVPPITPKLSSDIIATRFQHRTPINLTLEQVWQMQQEIMGYMDYKEIGSSKHDSRVVFSYDGGVFMVLLSQDRLDTNTSELLISLQEQFVQRRNFHLEALIGQDQTYENRYGNYTDFLSISIHDIAKRGVSGALVDPQYVDLPKVFLSPNVVPPSNLEFIPIKNPAGEIDRYQLIGERETPKDLASFVIENLASFYDPEDLQTLITYAQALLQPDAEDPRFGATIASVETQLTTKGAHRVECDLRRTVQVYYKLLGEPSPNGWEPDPKKLLSLIALVDSNVPVTEKLSRMLGYKAVQDFYRDLTVLYTHRLIHGDSESIYVPMEVKDSGVSWIPFEGEDNFCEFVLKRATLMDFQEGEYRKPFEFIQILDTLDPALLDVLVAASRHIDKYDDLEHPALAVAMLRKHHDQGTTHQYSSVALQRLIEVVANLEDDMVAPSTNRNFSVLNLVYYQQLLEQTRDPRKVQALLTGVLGLDLPFDRMTTELITRIALRAQLVEHPMADQIFGHIEKNIRRARRRDLTKLYESLRFDPSTAEMVVISGKKGKGSKSKSDEIRIEYTNPVTKKPDSIKIVLGKEQFDKSEQYFLLWMFEHVLKGDDSKYKESIIELFLDHSSKFTPDVYTRFHTNFTEHVYEMWGKSDPRQVLNYCLFGLVQACATKDRRLIFNAFNNIIALDSLLESPDDEDLSLPILMDGSIRAIAERYLTGQDPFEGNPDIEAQFADSLYTWLTRHSTDEKSAKFRLQLIDRLDLGSLVNNIERFLGNPFILDEITTKLLAKKLFERLEAIDLDTVSEKAQEIIEGQKSRLIPHLSE